MTDLSDLVNQISLLPPGEQEEMFRMLKEYTDAADREKSQNSFMNFVLKMWPGFISGRHHKLMADKFERVANGELKRLIINMPPRHTKSEFASYLLPAWFLGRYPGKKVIQTSHTAELAVGFGRKVRNLVDSEAYKAVFPNVALRHDSKAAGRWATNEGGEYFAIGVGGAVTGKGADLLIIDDPHSEQEAKQGRADVFEPAWEWFQSGPVQRLMPGGAIIVIMTRWSQLDLTGMLINHQIKNPDADKWEIVELPAILYEDTDNEKSLWPEQWPLEELRAKKANMDPRFWQAQYMQSPTSEVAAIVKREYWQLWEKEKPPTCEYIIQSWDTAHETKTSSDYSACTTWGVWYNEDDNNNAHIILLDAIKNRWTFPDLKKRALEYYKEWQPDACLIEKKAAGAPLIQELRSMGIPVSEFSPSRGKMHTSSDKTARLNSVVDIFASSRVWVPDTRWAREVVEEVAAFPAGDHDDYVDTVIQALMRLRMGGFIGLPLDAQEEPREFRSFRKSAYY